MTYIVALTGTIGSGKTTVANLFGELGIEIIDADIIARELTTTNKNIITAITDYFGKEILNNTQQIDRKKLQQIIFNDKAKKLWLEQLIHPEVQKIIKQTTLSIKSAYAIVAIPLLRSKSIELYSIDAVLTVTCDLETQLNRVEQRDNINETTILKIITSQKQEKNSYAATHYTIENNASIESLKAQVTNLDEIFRPNAQ
ncbi:MAG: dephospho-CoA kinase [Legionellales bacterium]|nr:dephospho-CoA kinase [Legionellales bacterium]